MTDTLLLRACGLLLLALLAALLLAGCGRAPSVVAPAAAPNVTLAPLGAVPRSVAEVADRVLVGPGAGAALGAVLAAGDYDGDGYADLACGLPWTGGGQVSVSWGPDLRRSSTIQGEDYFGAAVRTADRDLLVLAAGRAEAGRWRWSGTALERVETWPDVTALGWPGDLDGDGLEDVLLGRPEENRLLVQYGDGTRTVYVEGASGERWGTAAAVREGALVVGAPRQVCAGVSTGAVWQRIEPAGWAVECGRGVLDAWGSLVCPWGHGSQYAANSLGLGRAGGVVLVDGREIEGVRNDDELGSALGPGAVGAHRWEYSRQNQGAVWVLPDAWPGGGIGTLRPLVGERHYDQLGAGLAVADFNGDGEPDYALGANGVDTGGDNAGAVYILLSHERDDDGDRLLDWYEMLWSGAPGDVDGDGAVSNLDALRIQTAFLGLDEPPAGWRGDVNRDGAISNLDALIVQAWFVGGEGTLPRRRP